MALSKIEKQKARASSPPSTKEIAGARPISLFLGATYAISWTMAATFFALERASGKAGPPMLLGVPFMMVPGLVAFALQKGVLGGDVREGLGLKWSPNRFWALAWLAPLVLVGASLGLSLLMPGVSFDPGLGGFFARMSSVLPPEKIAEMRAEVVSAPLHPFWMMVLQGLVAGASINALVAMGEEIGWRGFMYTHLHGARLKRSLLTGLAWGVWHAPLVIRGHNYPDHPMIGVAMMVVWTMALAPLFDIARARGASVIAAALLHGSINALGGLPLLVLRGGNDLTVGFTGAAGLVVLAITSATLVMLERKRAQNESLAERKAVNTATGSSAS